MTTAHADRAHARLSASGSKKWLSCTPSVKLEEHFPDETSEFAEEGTLAHELAELEIKSHLNLIKPHDWNTEIKTISRNKFYSNQMWEHIKDYKNFVIERINAARAITQDAIIMLEQRLDFSQWVVDGFGTGDVVIVADRTIEIIDLKYGKGVRVEAEDNSQLMLYGLGAYAEYGHLYDFDTVRLTIVQPRLDNISSAEYDLTELLYWGDTYVYPRAQLAAKGDGEFVPGDHCRFCKAKTLCRARADQVLEVSKHEFKHPNLLTHNEIGELLRITKLVEKWIGDLEKYALDQAHNHGVKFNGFKLVEGRSNRKYTDINVIASRLLSEGYSDTEIFKPRELHSITELEEILGKKRFAGLLNDYIVKATGKPALVPISDKRPEISTAAAAISDFE